MLFMDIEVRVDIAADRAAVWQSLAAVEDWPRWSKSVTTVKRLEPGPLVLGASARIKQPGIPAMVWKVTELAEQESFTWEARAVGVVTTADHVLEDRDGGVTLVLTVRQRGFLAGLVGRLFAERNRRYVEMEAAGHEACSEQAWKSTA